MLDGWHGFIKLFTRSRGLFEICHLMRSFRAVLVRGVMLGFLACFHFYRCKLNSQVIFYLETITHKYSLLCAIESESLLLKAKRTLIPFMLQCRSLSAQIMISHKQNQPAITVPQNIWKPESINCVYTTSCFLTQEIDQSPLSRTLAVYRWHDSVLNVMHTARRTAYHRTCHSIQIITLQLT